MEFASVYKRSIILLIVSILLVLITLSTHYFGSADIGDYSDTAKFFAGKYSAKLRASHSYLYGFIFSFFIKFAESFFVFKIGSLIFISLIVLSIYYMTGKNKRSLWLMLLSPVVWYMAPWINPIQLASLIFLWAFYFMQKYDKTEKLKFLLYSSFLIGLGWAVWDTILFFGVFLFLCFIIDKKFIYSIYSLAFILIGLAPRLILDYVLFNFPFYTILKSFAGQFVFILGGSIYGGVDHFDNMFKLINFLMIFLSIPIYYWIVYTPDFFKNSKKPVIFVSLCLLLILMNPQARYMIAIAPIMILLISSKMNTIRFRRQIVFSIVIIFFFTLPYIIQIVYDIDNAENGADFTYILRNPLINLNNEFLDRAISRNINEIAGNYPNEVFLVGPTADSYQVLAHIYWGSKVKEFVSIQDYELYLKNDSLIFSKKFMPVPNIADRRQLWIIGGISKNEIDNTDYESINYMINIGNSSVIDGFEKIQQYEKLSLWKKAV